MGALENGRPRPQEELIMSFVSGTIGNEAAQKFLEVLQNDFRTLSTETKKKYPQIKEVSLAIHHSSVGRS